MKDLEPTCPRSLAEVRSEVRRALGETLGCAPADVDTSLRLTELPDMDSLRIVELVSRIEKVCGVRLDEDALFGVRTGEDLCALIWDSMSEGTSRDL